LPDTETLDGEPDHRRGGIAVQAGLVQPFLDAVAAARTAPPLRPEDLRGTLLGTRVGALLFPGERGWTALLPLSGVRDARP
jgi:predicted exporter